MERALGDPGVAIRGHGALPGCPHGGPVPSASPTQAGIRGDSSVGAGFGRLSPLLCTTRETLASMAGMSRQPGTKTQSSRALRHPQAAPAVSAACQSEAFLFILTRLTCIFPPPLCRSPRGLQDAARRWGAWAARRSPTRKSLAGRGWGGRNPIPIPPARRREPSAALPGACCHCCPRPGGPGRGGLHPVSPPIPPPPSRPPPAPLCLGCGKVSPARRGAVPQGAGNEPEPCAAGS